MTRQDKLQLQYEDAVFALLVDDAAQSEGEELLALNERLKANPDAAVPEELDKKCREAIRGAFRKEQAKKRAVSFKKTAKLLLTAVLIAAVLFTVAYAAVPEFQVAVKNLILEITKTYDSTHFTFKPQESALPEDADIYRYTLPEVLDGYRLIDDYSFEYSDYRCYWYEKDLRNEYIINIEPVCEAGVYTYDSEDAQSVTDIVINGYSGICILKNGSVQIAWHDTDRNVLLSIYASDLPKEKVVEMARAIRYVPPEAAVSPEATGVYRYSLPPIPDGYTLVEENSFEDPKDLLYWYESDNENNYYTVQIDTVNETSVVSVDTEDAQSVTDIVINGYSGIRVLKNGRVHIVWVDTDRSVFISVCASALPEEQVIEMAQAIRYVEPQQ